MIFETHAHYDDSRYDDDREQVIDEIKRHNIGRVVNVGADMLSSKSSIDLAKKYDFIYATVGVHPHCAKDMTDKDIETLRTYALEEKVVAIGEIGLDYHYNLSDKDSQIYWFRRQLELANELDMPVVIHSREATEDTFKIIFESKVKSAVIHCFSQSVEMAQKYVDLGYYLGIGGVLTYKNTKILANVVRNVTIDKILLETDSPYLAPSKHRGKRNSSKYIPEIIDKISEIKQISYEEVEEKTFCNSMSFYRLK